MYIYIYTYIYTKLKVITGLLGNVVDDSAVSAGQILLLYKSPAYQGQPSSCVLMEIVSLVILRKPLRH